ncbi:KAP family P-loop NTPase fold protein [Reichenbachiella versicolor]|uniref:KAP family P-loop NTPase fold protein n=1 Tax=Reichenbachiella versicolor TaxID=1821036 RepID=UPI000D6DFB69|nr:P-loop NTPase fold protein [Reichenbachiella versicolor]
MEKIELTKEEKYLLYNLHDVYQNYSEEVYLSPFSILSFWVGDLVVDKLINKINGTVNGLYRYELIEKPEEETIRISKKGISYTNSNTGVFDKVRFEDRAIALLGSYEKLLAKGEEVPSKIKSGKSTNAISLVDEIQNIILKELLLRKERYPNLKFSISTSKSDTQFKQWAKGNETYIHIDFTRRIDFNSSRSSISFQIGVIEKSVIGTLCSISYLNEDNKDIIRCYHDIQRRVFKDKSTPSSNPYKESTTPNWFVKFTEFLNKDLKQINEIIEKHNLASEFEISDERFNEKLSETFKKREQLGYSPITFSGITPTANSKNTDSDILSDNPSKKDDLGRKLLMDLLHQKIETLWKTQPEDESYTVLLNGEWGSGKSSMLYYLKENLADWEVIEYNAWRHQHQPDQWWVLVNKVSKALSSFSVPDNIPYFRSHQWWFFKMKHQFPVMSIILILLFLGSSGLVINSLINNGIEAKQTQLYLGTASLAVTLVLSIIGILTNLFSKKISTSNLFKANIADPYEPIKNRFDKVVANKNVAIFIDDLDRCEVDATVCLLEGIQNLFKESKVLYVIAADGKWVSSCFAQKYNEFNAKVGDGKIGHKFLEKTFQMIVDVPQIDDRQHKELLSVFLGLEPNVEDNEAYDEEVTRQETDKFRTTDEIEDYSSNTSNINKRYAAARKADRLIEEQKGHILEEYSDVIPRNPRQMKRLVNQLSIKFQTLILYGTKRYVPDDALIRYVLFSNEYPFLNDQIRKKKTTLESLKDENEYPEVSSLVGDHLTNEMIVKYL